jgi:hypothetical protein
MNITELRNDLLKVYDELRNKKIGISEAKEAANIVGKVVSSAKAQLEYNKWAGSKAAIEFMQGE